MKAQSTAKPEQSRHQDSRDRGGQGQGQQAMAVLDSRPEMAQQQGLLSLMAGSPRLQRKCACGAPSAAGGSCAACEVKANGAKPVVLQKQLAIGAADDPLEREADRVADLVMAGPAHSGVNGAPLRIQRFQGQGDGQMDSAPASVERLLASSGRPLEPGLRKDMEQRFGHDFSRVRVHSSTQAEQSAREVNAHAYTVGNNIVFGAGRFMPGAYQGRRLIAHELTHVVQQTGADQIDNTGSSGRMLQRDVTDPLELMAGVTNESVHTIVIDPSSGRTRFYTRGGKSIDGQLVSKASSFSLGEYWLEKAWASDALRTWNIFNANGSVYRGGLEFRVVLDGVDFGAISYTTRIKLRVASGVLPKLIDIEQRIQAIRSEVSKKLVNDAEELTIIKLLGDIPPEQTEAFVSRLRKEMIGEMPLLERLDRDIDGDNNIALHQALSRLKLQAGGSKTAAALAEAPELAWHDVMGFFEQKAVFSIKRTDKGKIRIRYLGGITGGLYSNPDFAEIKSMSRKDRLNLMTGEGIEVDADQPIIVHDYDSDRQIVMTAEDLIAYQHAGVRKFLQDVGTIASLATPAGAETVGGRVLAYGIQIASVATLIVDENKLNIRKWFPNWGPAIIDASEKIKIALAVVGISQLVHGGWKLFANLRRLRNARAAMDVTTVASTAEELSLAERQAARLEGQADDLLRQAELARKELGLVDEAADVAKGVDGVGGPLAKANETGDAAHLGTAARGISPADKNRIIDVAIDTKDFTGEFSALANKELSSNVGKLRLSKVAGYAVEVPIEGTEHFLARQANGTWCLFSGTPKGCGVIRIANEVDRLITGIGGAESIVAHGKALGLSDKEIRAFINLKDRTVGMTIEQALEEMSLLKGKGLSVELTEKQWARLQRVSEALNDESKWVHVSHKDRWRLGRVYDKVLESLVSEGMRRAGQPVMHYVEINASLINKLRANGNRVLITEGRLASAGLRLDMVEIDFAKGRAELVDIAATSSTRHLEKTKNGKSVMEKLLGMPVDAKELYYTGSRGELLEDLVEVIVK